METTTGKLVIQLLPDLAPDHVAGIKELVSEKAYDGVVFYRVISDFIRAARISTRSVCAGMGGSDKLDLKGYAVGGLAVGEPQAVMLDMLDVTFPALPTDRPRYLMGVGTPDDILKSVAHGVDMFDCVLPTRSGRHGLVFTRRGKVNLRNARYAEDMRPLDEQSACPASRDYSCAYLHHLIRANESLGGMLLSWHNLSYYQQLMQGIRLAIEEGRFANFYAKKVETWARGDIDPA